MRIRIVFLSFFFLLLYSNSYSQGIIRGKVTDETGETVIGAAVYIKSNTAKATTTDIQGTFVLKITDSTSQILVISLFGYQVIEQPVNPKKGEVINLSFELKPVTKEIKEVVIEGKADKARDFYMEKIKINSSTTIDYISSETIKKTGDANVAAAVARVPGVSSNGSFITVRGIGDRYIKTLLNGSVIPTLDPLTNNIKLDLFPSSLVDNLFITKTASAEYPGDFSGALISIETKDFPDKLTINVESTFGYNAQSTLTNIISSDRSSTEWLGYDGNLRDVDHSKFKEVKDSPSEYEKFVYLGLQDYYASIGVTSTTPWNEDYYKLGLVQLGFLNPGEYNDANAVNEAKAKFENDNKLRNEVFKIVNKDAVEFSQSLPNNWDTRVRRTPLNFSQTFSIGNQFIFLNRPIGVLAGFKYSSSVLYDSSSVFNRVQPTTNIDEVTYLTYADQQSTRETNGWNALIQLSGKINENNQVGLMFMPNFIGVNNIRQNFDTANGIFNLVTKDQFYEHRRQNIFQYKSNHFIPSIKLKFDINASYTLGKSEAPDFKSLQYGRLPNNQNVIGGLLPVRRFYRYLDENILDTRIKFELPFFEKQGLSRKLKFGSSYLQNQRESKQYEYFLSGSRFDRGGFENDDLTGYLILEDFGFNSVINDFNQEETVVLKSYKRVNLDSYHTKGHNKIFSGFAAVDFTIIKKLRIAAGIRAEHTDTYTDVYKYDSLGYGRDDERRLQLEDLFIVNPGEVFQWNFLPSANLIYKLVDNPEHPLNLRFNFSKTIARPSIRELTESAIFDYEYRTFIFGNGALKTSDIFNFDFRVEKYFNNGDNVSMSLFQKNIRNHIEMVQTFQGFSWQNADSSYVRGIEFDIRKKIVKGLEFRGNATIVKSETTVIQNGVYVIGGKKVLLPIDTITRAMSGQAPYVFNLLLTYNWEKIGLTSSVAYNIQGPRLSVVSADVRVLPDVYEMPRNLIDIKLSKSIGKNFQVSFLIKDLLNTPIKRSYKYPGGYLADFDSFRFGTNYYFSLSYRF